MNNDFDLKQFYKQVPWITKEGDLDLSQYPIENPIKDTTSANPETFRNACRLLSSMIDVGNIGAGIYLMGLINYYRGDIKRLEIIVDAISSFRTKTCAKFLFNELIHTKSDNTTKIYLNSIIEILKYFPPDLVKDKFEELSHDKNFSYRLRKKFIEIVNFGTTPPMKNKWNADDYDDDDYDEHI